MVAAGLGARLLQSGDVLRAGAEHRHAFLFGHCDLATERHARKRRLLAELFNYTCPTTITKWKSVAKKPDRYDFSKVDAALGFCQGREIAFEWHFLAGYHPEWLEEIGEDEEKGRHQKEHARAILERYRGKVQFFQVTNEDWRTHQDRAKVYTDHTTWFAELREEFPDVELGVCDGQVGRVKAIN